MEGVARLDTSLQQMSMPPRRAIATTEVFEPKSTPAHAMVSDAAGLAEGIKGERGRRGRRGRRRRVVDDEAKEG